MKDKVKKWWKENGKTVLLIGGSMAAGAAITYSIMNKKYVSFDTVTVVAQEVLDTMTAAERELKVKPSMLLSIPKEGLIAELKRIDEFVGDKDTLSDVTPTIKFKLNNTRKFFYKA